jgi:hypothetical protein
MKTLEGILRSDTKENFQPLHPRASAIAAELEALPRQAKEGGGDWRLFILLNFAKAVRRCTVQMNHRHVSDETRLLESYFCTVDLISSSLIEWDIVQRSINHLN